MGNLDRVQCDWNECGGSARAQDLWPDITMFHRWHETGDLAECDSWVCACGNTPNTSGFHPCDRTGAECEPVEGWGNLYRCGDCGRIIDGTTGRYVRAQAEACLYCGPGPHLAGCEILANRAAALDMQRGPDAFTLDGEALSLIEFVNCNDLSDADMDELARLAVGEEIVYGGGAAAVFVLRRVR